MALIKRILKVDAKLENFKNGLTRLFIAVGGVWIIHVGYAYNEDGIRRSRIYFFDKYILHFDDFLIGVTLGLLSLFIFYASIIWIAKGFTKEQ